MLQKNKEAKSLIQSTQELIQETDKELQSYDDHACESISKYAQLRKEILDGSLKEFEEHYETISNYDYIYKGVTFSDEELENVQDNFYEKAPTIEPIEIPRLSTGGFSSIIVGLIWGIISIVLFIGGGIFMTKTKIDPNALPKTVDEAMTLLNPIFTHFGNIIVPENGTALHGMLLVGGVSAVVALLFGLSRYHSRSTKNLQLTKEIHEKAQEQKLQKKLQQEKIMSLCKYTQDVDATLYTLNLYLQEYNAVIKRILHTEGDDYDNMTELSRKKIQTAAIIDREIIRLINTEMVTENGEVNPLSRYALTLAKEYLQEIRDGELEIREETPYVEEDYIQKEEEVVESTQEAQETEGTQEEETPEESEDENLEVTPQEEEEQTTTNDNPEQNEEQDKEQEEVKKEA